MNSVVSISNIPLAGYGTTSLGPVALGEGCAPLEPFRKH